MRTHNVEAAAGALLLSLVTGLTSGGCADQNAMEDAAPEEGAAPEGAAPPVSSIQSELYEDRCSIPTAAAAIGWVTGVFNYPYVSGTFGYANGQTYRTSTGRQTNISPCAWHDHCYHSGYGVYGYSRGHCDSQFNVMMKRECTSRYEWWDPRRAYCHWQRGIVHGAVRAFGDAHYRAPACSDPTWMYVADQDRGGYKKGLNDISCSTRRFPEEYFDGELTGVQERRKKLSGFAESLNTTLDAWMADPSAIQIRQNPGPQGANVAWTAAPMSVGTLLDRYIQHNACSVYYNSPSPNSYPGGCAYTYADVPRWAPPEYAFPPNVPCDWVQIYIPDHNPYFQLLKRYFPQRFQSEMQLIVNPPPGFYTSADCKVGHVMGFGYWGNQPSVLNWADRHAWRFEEAFGDEVAKHIVQEQHEAFGAAVWAPLVPSVHLFSG